MYLCLEDGLLLLQQIVSIPFKLQFLLKNTNQLVRRLLLLLSSEFLLLWDWNDPLLLRMLFYFLRQNFILFLFCRFNDAWRRRDVLPLFRFLPPQHEVKNDRNGNNIDRDRQLDRFDANLSLLANHEAVIKYINQWADATRCSFQRYKDQTIFTLDCSSTIRWYSSSLIKLALSFATSLAPFLLQKIMNLMPWQGKMKAGRTVSTPLMVLKLCRFLMNPTLLHD